ncbi:MAG: efflux RND transporter periplasmic adaptor subunit [Rikenellaceae bacterium]
MNKEFKRAMALMLSAIAFVGCQQEAANPAANQPTEYEMMTIATSDVELSAYASATIRGRQDIEIYPQVSGLITKMNVIEGQPVKKGDVLFVIDQIPYLSAVATAKATVANAKATLATADLTFESRKRLFADGVVSQYDLTTAENNLMIARAALEQAMAQLLNAENNLSFTTVSSPADGVIGTLPYRVGALVSSAISQPLTTVSDNSVMNVYFSMAENDLLALIRNYGSSQKAIKEMPAVSLQLSDGSMYDQQGKIVSISGVINRSTGTVTLRADFKNPNGLLHSGATGNVVMPTHRDDVVVIPQGATYELQNKTYVYKNVDGKASSTVVEVERINGGKSYIVNDGLAVGDQIITEGVSLLREGRAVAPKSSTPKAAPAAESAK